MQVRLFVALLAASSLASAETPFEQSLFAALANLARTNAPTSSLPPVEIESPNEDSLVTESPSSPDHVITLAVDTASPTTTASPTLLDATLAPTEEVTLAPTEAVTLAPTEEVTLAPTEAVTLTPTTLAPSAAGDTSAPSASPTPAAVAVVVVPETTEQPTLMSDSVVPSAAPTPVVVVVPESTNSPTQEGETVTPTSAEIVPPVIVNSNSTASPSSDAATSSPTLIAGTNVPLTANETEITPSPTLLTTESPTLMDEPATDGTVVVVVPTNNTEATTSPTLAEEIATNQTIIVVVPTNNTEATTSPTLAEEIVTNQTIIVAVPTNNTEATTSPTLAEEIVTNGTIIVAVPANNATAPPTLAEEIVTNGTIIAPVDSNSTVAADDNNNTTLIIVPADNTTSALIIPADNNSTTLAPTTSNDTEVITPAANSTVVIIPADNSTVIIIPADNSSTLAPTSNNNNTAGFIPPYVDIGADYNATSNMTLTPVLYNCTEYPTRSIQYWNCSAENQLILFELAGEEAESHAMSLLLALHRICDYKDNITTFEQALQLKFATQQAQDYALVNLRTNRTASEELLLVSGSQRQGLLATELRAAVESALSVIHSLERLVDTGHAVQNSSSNCAVHFTPQAQNVQQYQLQYNPQEVSTTSTVLAALMGCVGFLLLVLPAGRVSSVLIYSVASSYIWAFAAYMAAWYGFDLMNASTWQSANWWRAYYASYVIGLAAWLLVMCLAFMVRRYWLAAGALAGVGFGGVLGIQLNALALWQFGAGYASYMTISICMACGAVLFGLVFMLWAHLKPSYAIFHLVGSLVGSYFLIKMIGVLVGNYPSEIYLTQYEQETQGEVYGYIIAMWILTILLFVCQSLVYGVWKPIAPSAPADEKKHDADNGDTRSAASSSSSYWRKSTGGGKGAAEEERAPLLTGSETRRRKQEEDVVEFGGVRALKAEGGQSTKSLLV